MLLAETNEGYHNLIKLVSSGYTEGFYYKPRIDKELLAQHAKGLIGLSSCLKGEVATGIRTEQQQKAVAAAAAYRDILGRGNFFLEMQYQGIDDQRIVNIGLQPIAKDLGLDLVVTNDVHYLQNSDSPAARRPAVHRHRQDGQRHGAAEVSRRPVLPEDRRGDGGGLSGLPGRDAATRCDIAERCNVDLSFKENYLPNFDVPPGFTLDDYFEHDGAAGLRRRGCRGCRSSPAAAC